MSQKSIPLDEPAAQIKSLPLKIPLGIFNKNALQNEAQRCCVVSGQF
jgi:hypothetical protein